MVVCRVCDGKGVSLQDGLCCECNGTGEDNPDYDDVMFEDESEDVRPSEPFDLKQWWQ